MLILPTSTNRVEAVRQFVHTLCIFRFQNITSRELDLLCEILRCEGVNDKSKNSFMLNYKTTKENYGQLVKRLSDKGILINVDRRNGKRMHQDLIQIYDQYINSSETNYLWLEWKVT
jgi:hypothetical protein